MISLIIQFIKHFGKNKRYVLLFLFLGSSIGGLIELCGVALIFYFISILTEASFSSSGHLSTLMSHILAGTSSSTQPIIVVALICSVYSLKSLHSIFFNIIKLRLIRDLKDTIAVDLMMLYLRAPASYYSKRNSIAIMTTLRTSVSYCIYYFLMSAISFWSNLVVIAALIFYLLSFNSSLAIYSGLFFVLMGLIQHKIVKRHAKSAGKDALSLIEKNKIIVQDNIKLAKDIKILHQEEYFGRKFKDSNLGVANSDMKIDFFQTLPLMLNDAMMAITMLGIFVIVYLKSPDLMLATFGTMLAVVARLAPYINSAIRDLAQIHSGKVPVEELIKEYEALKKISEQPSSSTAPHHAMLKELKFSNVSYSYDDASDFKLTIDSLSINRGEYIGIVGRSGAGKTTLVNLISGLFYPAEGTIKLDGNAIDKDTISMLRSRVGFVHQGSDLLNETLANNISFGRSKDEHKKLMRALDISGLSEIKKSSTIVGESGNKLSGGQKQRVSIARAVYSDPDLLILDEATSELDIEAEHSILKSIEELKKTKTIITVAHRLTTLKRCDKIIYIDKGSIIDVGNFDELSSRHESFDELIKFSQMTQAKRAEVKL